MISLNNKELNINCQEMESVVKDFCQESDKEYHSCNDLNGLFQQTMENIGNVVINRPTNQFIWIDADINGKILAYVLTHISKDIDNKLCYYMTQAWLHPSLRNTGYSKQAIELLRQHAKQKWCKHIVVVSSRNTKAYLRFLGKQWHVYTTLLKEDI